MYLRARVSGGVAGVAWAYARLHRGESEGEVDALVALGLFDPAAGDADLLLRRRRRVLVRGLVQVALAALARGDLGRRVAHPAELERGGACAYAMMHTRIVAAEVAADAGMAGSESAYSGIAEPHTPSPAGHLVRFAVLAHLRHRRRRPP
jgi:hypothetical protein